MTEDRSTAESRAMEHVAFRMREAFASRVSGRDIDERVRAAYHRFDGSKVREFVPLLVENAVRRELLAGLRADPGSAFAATVGGGTVGGGTVVDGTVVDGTVVDGTVVGYTARPDTFVA